MAEIVCINLTAPHDPDDGPSISDEMFTDAHLSDIRRIKEIFDPVHPLTIEQWKEAFLFHESPDKELAWWLSFSEVYLEYTEGMSLDACRQAFLDLLGMTVDVPSSQLKDTD
jgi:hypothetical protein